MELSTVHDPAAVPGSFTRRDRAALAAITLAGAALRIAYAWGRPRLGDEIGTLINLHQSAGYLLTHFSGWLTMNYFILAEKGVAALTGSEGWPLELLPLLGGIATIPLTASLARRLGGVTLALIAGTLVAFNPYLVSFSPVLRAYAPLAALAVWAVDRFFHWRERRTWGAGSWAAVAVLLMLLAHPNGVYVAAGLGVLTGAEAAALWQPRSGDARRAYLSGLATLAAPMAGAGLATWLAYRQLGPDVRIFTAKWSAAPPTSMDYLPEMFAAFFGSGFPLFVPAGLLLAGGWSATQTRQPLLALCVLAGLSPVFVSLKGVSHFPWAYTRFQIYCVPLLLIVMAEGIRWLSAWAGRGFPRRAGAALTAVALLAWLPPTQDLFARKHADAAYAGTAAYLRARQRPGDLVVVASTGIQLPLTPLLPTGPGGPVGAAEFVKNPDGLGEGGRVWFVAASDPPLGAPEARHVCGKLQVVTYAGPAAAACAGMRADFLRVATGRTDANLGSYYGLLALLDKGQPAAPGATTAREWRLLARLCRTQTGRFRSLPVQLRGRGEGTDGPEADLPAASATPTPRATDDDNPAAEQ